MLANEVNHEGKPPPSARRGHICMLAGSRLVLPTSFFGSGRPAINAQWCQWDAWRFNEIDAFDTSRLFVESFGRAKRCFDVLLLLRSEFAFTKRDLDG